LIAAWPEREAELASATSPDLLLLPKHNPSNEEISLDLFARPTDADPGERSLRPGEGARPVTDDKVNVIAKQL
jgi:hypothetical protein